MTKAELERQLTRAVEMIADLKREVEYLEQFRGDADDVGARFAALCRELDACLPLRRLPCSLRLEFESLAERLGVSRPW